MAIALPAPVPSGEYRALTLYEAAPADCVLWPVRDHSAAPHLRVGEFAVVDVADRDPITGELFLIEWQGGRRSLMQARLREVSIEADGAPVHRWFADPLSQPRSAEELLAWLDQGRAPRLSEGPFRPGGLERMIVGRVVGVVPMPARAFHLEPARKRKPLPKRERAARAARARASWCDPEIRAGRIAALAETRADPARPATKPPAPRADPAEVSARKSAAMRALWSDPQRRAAMLASMKADPLEHAVAVAAPFKERARRLAAEHGLPCDIAEDALVLVEDDGLEVAAAIREAQRLAGRP